MTTFSREAWAAPAAAGGNRLTGPLHRVFVHHTVGRTPSTVDEALAEVLAIWHQHTGVNGWSDIGYSWLVDDAGNAYEGRGWLRSGAHTEGYNSTAHAICWMGNSMTRRPSNSAVAAIAQCVLDGQRVGAVGPSPTIEGHRDVNATACPGDSLYDALPTIRLAVLGGDLGGATTPPTPEDEPMTEEDRAWHQSQYNAISGTVTTNAAYLGQWMQGLAGEHQQIMARLAALEAKLAAPSADDIVLAAARRIVSAP